MSLENASKPKAIKLLLIDDEVGFVDTLAKRLQLRGIVATKAYDGNLAIQAMRGHVFDIALLDLKMANLDGFETLKIMKKLDPGMPVIILSGHGTEEAFKEAMALGAGRYVTKPFDFNELVAMIKKTVAGGES
jgi:DNA-binding response OmpR family regulator